MMYFDYNESQCKSSTNLLANKNSGSLIFFSNFQLFIKRFICLKFIGFFTLKIEKLIRKIIFYDIFTNKLAYK